MPADSTRILDLRRRVQSDPASIAFAHLAEELRRVGSFDEAAVVCRAGLARHPGYLSARVTLGRTLLELGNLEEAARELGTVIEFAPDNLSAIRGLAEIKQLKGEMAGALSYYKRAMELARHDPELEETVDRISQVIEPPKPVAEPAKANTIEELFDFDRLIEQLGMDQPSPAAAAAAAAEPRSHEQAAAASSGGPPPSPGGAPPGPQHVADDDPLAALEAALRVGEAASAPSTNTAPQGDGDAQALRDLDGWLAAISADRA